MKKNIVEYTQSLTVPFEFSVYFSRGVFNCASPIIADAISKKEKGKQHKVLFVVEAELLSVMPELIADIEDYCEAHVNVIEEISHTVMIKGGEQLKSFSEIESLCGIIEENNLCRHSFIGIVGGGAFLDAVGFAASIVHRGIRQLRFPTTVLSQCDSGVGVKNGINMFEKKNFVGTFAPPFAVINDFNFLDTLNERDWRAGIAEAIKVAIIKDKLFFKWLCDNAHKLALRDTTAMEYLVEKSATIHSDHIRENQDPFEFGSARPLDFGHWAAHKLETLTQNRLRHGEAVAIGIVIDSYYALQKHQISKIEFKQIEKLFTQLGFKLWDEGLSKTHSSGSASIIDGIGEFQEHLGGELHITLPHGIGNKCEVTTINEQIMKNALEYLNENHR